MMANANVTIHGRNFNISCDEGNENHIDRLGKYNELAAVLGALKALLGL